MPPYVNRVIYEAGKWLAIQDGRTYYVRHVTFPRPRYLVPDSRQAVNLAAYLDQHVILETGNSA